MNARDVLRALEKNLILLIMSKRRELTGDCLGEMGDVIIVTVSSAPQAELDLRKSPLCSRN